jgi:hypothetical protein
LRSTAHVASLLACEARNTEAVANALADRTDVLNLATQRSPQGFVALKQCKAELE